MALEQQADSGEGQWAATWSANSVHIVKTFDAENNPHPQKPYLVIWQMWLVVEQGVSAWFGDLDTAMRWGGEG